MDSQYLHVCLCVCWCVSLAGVTLGGWLFPRTIRVQLDFRTPGPALTLTLAFHLPGPLELPASCLSPHLLLPCPLSWSSLSHLPCCLPQPSLASTPKSTSSLDVDHWAGGAAGGHLRWASLRPLPPGALAGESVCPQEKEGYDLVSGFSSATQPQFTHLQNGKAAVPATQVVVTINRDHVPKALTQCLACKSSCSHFISRSLLTPCSFCVPHHATHKVPICLL